MDIHLTWSLEVPIVHLDGGRWMTADHGSTPLVRGRLPSLASKRHGQNVGVPNAPFWKMREPETY
jgi:hypothetical protein